MDINNTHGNQNIRAQQRYREAMVELVRRTRGKVQAAREQAANTTADRTAQRELEARPAQEPDRRDSIEISNKQQERIQNARLGNVEAEARPAAEVERKDQVDISNKMHARIQAYRLDNAEEDSSAKVARLRMAHQNGTLNTPERIERAAQNLLRDPAANVPDVANTTANIPNAPDEA